MGIYQREYDRVLKVAPIREGALLDQGQASFWEVDLDEIHRQ